MDSGGKDIEDDCNIAGPERWFIKVRWRIGGGDIDLLAKTEWGILFGEYSLPDSP